MAQWLNGEMVQTLLVVWDPAKYEKKNPSFARLQRVWRTTQQFWQTVQDEDIPAIAGQEQKRIVIDVDNADELQERLGKYHAYEIEINGQRLSVVWDSKDKCLLTASNLAAWGSNGADALLKQLKPGTELSLYELGGYGQRREERVSAKVARAEIVPVAYSPTIALLTQPASFMALVPAAVALDAATKITHRYELEMSKVRNRLPLFLGIVFFDCRQPLFSALDAGRRLLECHLPSVECTVTCSCDRSQQNGDKVLPYLEHNHFKRWQELKLTTIENGKFLHWYASTIMGDGETVDDWYPYVNVIRDAAGNPPSDRKQFEHEAQPEAEVQKWVHVSDVKEGDTICFAPSCFTWLFLDTSARRFEAGKIIKPLEELSRITSLWQRLKKLATDNKLSDSQLHAIITLLVSKKESWSADSAEYSQLAEAILHKEGLDMVTKEDLISGRLQAAFELYHYILKQKLKDETA